ncbi:hypothetical protein RHSP_10343 [Rhizobium freirei PRF 81]|uniref:Uncharacterized protein n=2 Tax=Rhizobium freirei TaxID=1353277 RepID=N6V6Y2_9HYPH|nr:hypothetical protein RHSP_10343 [Rhizobium freirei PRF 81]
MLLGLSVAMLTLVGPAAASAEDAAQQRLPQLDRGEKIEKLGFPAVLEKLTGWTKFGKGKVYTLPLKKGQHVRITFSSKSKYTFMAIFDLSSNDDESFFGTDEDGDTADVTLNEDTTWLIKPYYSRVTRRRGLGAPYEILIDPNPPATQQPADQQKDQGPTLFPSRSKQGQ